MKKVLIVGDSFASDWTVKYDGGGWPNMLSALYKIKNAAQAGCSQYKILQQLRKEKLDKYHYIIVSHTSPYRLPVKNHPIHSKDSLHKNSDLIYSDILEHSKTNDRLLGIVDYMENYMDVDYLTYVHDLISMEIEKLVKPYKVLNLEHIKNNATSCHTKIDLTKIQEEHNGLINHYSQYGNNLVLREVINALEKL